MPGRIRAGERRSRGRSSCVCPPAQDQRGQFQIERRCDLQIFFIAVGQLHGHAERFDSAAIIRDCNFLFFRILKRCGKQITVENLRGLDGV